MNWFLIVAHFCFFSPVFANTLEVSLDELDQSLQVEQMTKVSKVAFTEHLLRIEGKKIEKVLAFDGGLAEGSKDKFAFHATVQLQDGKVCESDLESTLVGDETKVVGKKIRCGLNSVWSEKEAFEVTAIEQDKNGKTQIMIKPQPTKMLSVKEVPQHSS